MQEKHPDYKGEDFLHLPGKKAPWEIEDDEWDNKQHNEDV